MVGKMGVKEKNQKTTIKEGRVMDGWLGRGSERKTAQDGIRDEMRRIS